MLIRVRLKNLTNAARRDEKKRIVVNWLLNNQVASIETLAAVLGLAANANNRFFAELIEEGVLERLRNTRWDKRDLVILGPQAAGYIDRESSDFTADLMKARKLKNKKYLAHDVEAQKVALHYLPIAIEIVAEHRIVEMPKKPDMIVFDEDGDQYAIEYESTAKSPATTYYIFHQYRDMIKKGMFVKVDFWFDDQTTLNSYKKYFDREYWPEVSYDKKKRTSKTLPEKVRILANDHVRGRVTFNLIDLKKPRIFSLDEACRPKKRFNHSYEVRKQLYAMDVVDRKAAELEARLEKEREQERLEAQEKHQEAVAAKKNLVQQIKDTLADIDASETMDGSYKAAALDLLGKYESKTPALRKKLVELTEELGAS
jgi:hypothetical protein